MALLQDFDKVFTTYYEPLYIFAHQFIGDDATCHDLVAATFEDIWSTFDTIDITTVKAYLYMALRNKCLNELRRQNHSQQYVKAVKVMTNDYLTECRYDDQQWRQQVVSEVFRVLEPPTSDIVRACFIEGLTYDEAAGRLHISVSTVNKHIVKALKILRGMKKKWAKA